MQGAWATLLLGVVMMMIMLFWTWAKVLKLAHVLAFAHLPLDQRQEDRFDGVNRRNLRHFIIAGEKGVVGIPTRGNPYSITPDADELDDAMTVQEQYYYLARDRTVPDQDEDRRELVRIPTCAIFHKFAAGKGVPHSFVGFIRQWPALPQVVVSFRFFLASRY